MPSLHSLTLFLVRDIFLEQEPQNTQHDIKMHTDTDVWIHRYADILYKHAQISDTHEYIFLEINTHMLQCAHRHTHK